MKLHPVVTPDRSRLLTVAADGYFSLSELSAYSSMSVRTLRTYLTRGRDPLPFFKPGGKVIVKRSEFDTWMLRFRRVTPSSAVDAIVSDVLRGL